MVFINMAFLRRKKMGALKIIISYSPTISFKGKNTLFLNEVNCTVKDKLYHT